MNEILLAISNEGEVLYTSNGEPYENKEVTIPYYFFSKKEIKNFTDLQLYEYDNKQSISIGKIQSSDYIEKYDKFYVRIVAANETLDVIVG